MFNVREVTSVSRIREEFNNNFSYRRILLIIKIYIFLNIEKI